MKIQILLFAQLREAAGYEQKMIEVSEGETAGNAVRQFFKSALDRFCGLPVRFAVNESFVDEGTVLQEGDTVAIIPPVSGG